MTEISSVTNLTRQEILLLELKFGIPPKTNEQVGECLSLTPTGVTYRLKKLKVKFNVSNLGALAQEVDRLRIVQVDPSLTDRFTPRQRQVLDRMTSGEPTANRTMAGELGIDLGTVETHVKDILGKLGAVDRVQGVAIAFRKGIVNGVECKKNPSVPISELGG